MEKLTSKIIKVAWAEEEVCEAKEGQICLLEPSVLPSGASVTSFEQYASLMFSTIFSLAILIAIITMAYGGLVYASAEQIAKKSEAKQQIYNSLAGLVLALAAYLILNTINPDLVKFNLNLGQL